MFQPQTKYFFSHPEKTHTASSKCSVLKLAKRLKPLVKVYSVIYSKVTIDRAEDTQPRTHKCIKSNALQVYTNTCDKPANLYSANLKTPSVCGWLSVHVNKQVHISRHQREMYFSVQEISCGDIPVTNTYE